MPPSLAFLAVSLFVMGILLADGRRLPRVSYGFWIPFAWMLVLASRPIAGWFDPSVGNFGAAPEDGSPLDRNALSLLMAMAFVVLWGRHLNWSGWVRENAWLCAFLLYCGISIIWSDFPAVALKRWIRALGSVMMILLVLSEKDPVSAIATLVRRTSYVLIPFSLLLIKYFRDLGVTHNEWTGAESLRGVTTDKNALGRLCLVAGLFALWDFLRARDAPLRIDTLNKLIGSGIFAATLWLLLASNSATSLACLVLGAGVLVAIKLPVIRNRVRYIGILVVFGGTFAVLVGLALNLPEMIVTSLGRNMTFTDRTFLWRDLFASHDRLLAGVGYDTFWLGERLDWFMRVHKVNEAHNGYIEVYLELGLIGLFLASGLLFSTFAKAKRLLTSNFEQGRLQMALLAVFVTYNATEAAYKATTSLAFVFLLIAITPSIERLNRHPPAVKLRQPTRFRAYRAVRVSG
jgi:exopolysaccharide production protein ExoQ